MRYRGQAVRTPRFTRFCRACASLVVVFAPLAIVASPAAAQVPKLTAEDAGKELASIFLGVSGYWFTDSSAIHGLGSPKFGGTTSFFVKDAHRYNVLITGGIEIAGASDHWLPFSGGSNSFSLTGAAFRVSAERKMNRLVPFMTAGIFDGHIHSDKLGIRTDVIVPSVAFGLRYQFHRYVAVSARYRLTPSISGINTSGFSLGLSFF